MTTPTPSSNGQAGVSGDSSEEASASDGFKNIVMPSPSYIDQLSIPEVSAFYQQFVNQLSAVCTLASALPLQEMLRANERLRTTGVLTMPQEINPAQLGDWLRRLEGDHMLITNLINTLAPLRGGR